MLAVDKKWEVSTSEWAEQTLKHYKESSKTDNISLSIGIFFSIYVYIKAFIS